MRIKPVRDTAELRRVLALPRRPFDLNSPEGRDEAEAAADEFTDLLVTPAGRRAGARLKAWQAFVLREWCEMGELGPYGTFFLGPVGIGKTLIAILAFLVSDARRPVLGIPASLRQKTYDDLARYAQHWQMPSPPPRVVTYKELTAESNVYLLDAIRPDVLVLDECDALKNHGASMVKRLGRHVDAAADDYDEGKGDGLRVLAESGTPGRLSIKDYSHLLTWCLKDLAPVPVGPDGPKQTDTWAAAIDEKPSRSARPGVGALRLFWDPTAKEIREGVWEESPGKRESRFKANAQQTLVDRARAAFRDRLCATPGVIVVDEESCAQPLTIELALAPEDETLDQHYAVFKTQWVTPDGRPLSDALSIDRADGELGTGLVLHWDPKPADVPGGEEWLLARTVFCNFVRDRIERTARSAHPLDTEAAVANAHPEEPCVVEWRRIKPTFVPNSVPMWLSSSVVEWAARWALKAPGLIWCKNQAFAERLSLATGLTVYGAKGESSDGRYVDKAPGDRSAIVTFDANMRGRNLQQFHRNLFVNPPQSARYIEQAIGRTHRYGQEKPVRVTWLVTSGRVLAAFDKAWAEAEFVRQTTGVVQKLLRAKVVRVDRPNSKHRWT